MLSLHFKVLGPSATPLVLQFGAPLIMLMVFLFSLFLSFSSASPFFLFPYPIFFLLFFLSLSPHFSRFFLLPLPSYFSHLPLSLHPLSRSRKRLSRLFANLFDNHLSHFVSLHLCGCCTFFFKAPSQISF